MKEIQAEAVSACTGGQVEQLQKIFANMDDADRQNSEFFLRMLRSAVKSSQVPVVQYLVSQGISFKLDRDTATDIAIAGSRPIYEAVYEVDPNVISLHFGHVGDPITVAVSTSNISVLSFLLDKKADPNVGRWLSRWSPIALAATCSSAEIISALVRYGAQISGSNALQNAARYGRLGLLRCLINLGADVNDASNYDYIKNYHTLETPLHSASRAGNLEIVKYLLNNGATPDLQDSEGRTAFAVARGGHREAIVKLLHYRTVSAAPLAIQKSLKDEGL
ncbi:Ankyrin repeat domain-containing protein 44 [Loxospora ochrophaea]|nr:Ankyrin repeat domain-containing protein 44 [Loxospora ochrophaea]